MSERKPPEIALVGITLEESGAIIKRIAMMSKQALADRLTRLYTEFVGDMPDINHHRKREFQRELWRLRERITREMDV